MQGTIAVAEVARRSGAQAYLAVYENNLANSVTSGENRGKQLRHDFVMRALAVPNCR